MGKELSDLADAYLTQYRRARTNAAAGQRPVVEDADFNAFDRVLDLTLTDDVESLWEVNIELIRKCRSLEELSFVAAGPVEDMLDRLGENDVDAVLKRASEDPRWRYAIASTYTSRMTPRLAAVIETIQRERTSEGLARRTELPSSGLWFH